ncbi:MAG: 2OG-Fe(II) oxygenase [Caulobacter sp.]|nr:2OG-Fe(II) oxygenase [Caulobacter sp.]
MPLTLGDLAPSFFAPNPSNPRYNFSSVAGRFVAMAFLPETATPESAQALKEVRQHRALFDDTRLCFFGIQRDAQAYAACQDDLPGIRWLHDVTGEVGRKFEITAPSWIVLDPSLRVVLTAPLGAAPALMKHLASLPHVNDHAGTPIHAPVLVAPRIFEPEFCKTLIGLYETIGGEPSGFMREVDGKTVVAMDPRHKKRSDITIDDVQIRNAARARINRRLSPLIKQAFQFEPTRMERYIVCCYDSESGGYFRPHRDNTTKGTAHRKFAVSINLSDDHVGGDLRFPEFGDRTYRPPLGGAVVFSCSLLHEATAVTGGRRFAFLPFLYDEDGARIREANNQFLGDGVGSYRSGLETAES